MSCERIQTPDGATAIVCGRGRPTKRDLEEIQRFAAFLDGDALAYTDPNEEARILADIRRQGAHA